MAMKLQLINALMHCESCIIFSLSVVPSMEKLNCDAVPVLIIVET